jgi:hypothetical protein
MAAFQAAQGLPDTLINQQAEKLGSRLFFVHL